MLKKLQALKAKKGFTLVELIVVIAIIGVLAAILIPTLSGVIESSRKRGVESTNSSIQNIAKAYCSQYTAKTGYDYKATGATVATVDMDDGKAACALGTYLKRQIPELSTSGKSGVNVTITNGQVTKVVYTEGSYTSIWDADNGGLQPTEKNSTSAIAANSVLVNGSADDAEATNGSADDAEATNGSADDAEATT